MPDKKLTDNEIKKALEDCINHDGACVDCPSHDFCDKNDSKILMEAVLDLINRLQAENERLQNTIIALMGYLDKIGADKTDTSFIQNATEFNAQLRADIKAEAYKECIEKVNNKIRFLENRGFSTHYVVKGALNNLLKELVGEDNAIKRCQVFRL